MSHWTKYDNDEINETIKEKQKNATYEARFVCTNCGNEYYLTLPFGTRKDAYNHKCPICGCK